MPESTDSQWASDSTANSAAARLTIPYLGPLPTPSRPYGYVLMVGCLVAAMLQVAKAVLSLRQAQLDQDFVSSGGTAELARKVLDGSHTLQTVSTASLWVVLVVVILSVVWVNKRRPKERRERQGEAYVESPTMWALPPALRWAPIALAGLSLVLTFSTPSAKEATISEFVHIQQMRAASALVLTVFWSLLALRVVLVNRSHDQRVARSAPYRADPSQVPFFPPIAQSGIFGSRR